MRRQLIALQHYQRRYGAEALLQRQCKLRRVAFSEGLNYKPPLSHPAPPPPPPNLPTCVYAAAASEERGEMVSQSNHLVIRLLTPGAVGFKLKLDYGTCL